MSKTSISSVTNVKGQSKLVPLFIVAAVAIFGISGWAWWHSVRSDPERTLYAAIENNLRTKSVTRQVSQGSGLQKLEQDVELSLSPKAIAHGSTTITQTGEVDARVKTEAISLTDREYVRYTDVQTNQKSAKGKQLDFTELLNVWGETSAEQSNGQPGELYGESVLGVVPTANLGASDRKALMKLIHDDNVYQFDEKSLERRIVGGRPTYVYDVTVAPAAYIKLLKQFGSVVNLKQLESLDPSQYANAQPLSFKLTIDVWGQKLTGIEYADGARTEKIGSYGINHDIDLPKESIPVEELQAKLQAAQQ